MIKGAGLAVQLLHILFSVAKDLDQASADKDLV